MKETFIHTTLSFVYKLISIIDVLVSTVHVLLQIRQFLVKYETQLLGANFFFHFSANFCCPYINFLMFM